MKKSVVIFTIVFCAAVIAGCMLYILGIIGPERKVEIETAGDPIGYVECADGYMTFDSEGRLVESVSVKPTELVKLSGITFENLVSGGKLECEQQENVTYALSIIIGLTSWNIKPEEVFISAEYEAIAYYDNVKILFGPDDGHFTEKAEQLKDMFSLMNGRTGTLHMEDYNDDGTYTFVTES